MKRFLQALVILSSFAACGSYAAQSKSSFGGASKSSSISGGGVRSSFGGASKSSPSSSVTSYRDRSSIPTRISQPPVRTATANQYVPPPKTSPFGGGTQTKTASGFGGQTKTVATNSPFGGQSRSTLPTRNSPFQQPKPTVATQSPADVALANRARASGTSFNNRQEAIDSFKNRYSTSTTYTYRYTTPPTVWPTHIPHSYRYNNLDYGIVYNPTYSEYGYWYGSTWRHYDLYSDLVMMDVVMHQHDYYYSPPIVTYDAGYSQPYNTQPVVVNSVPPNGWTFLIVVGVILGLVVVVAVVANLKS